MTGGALSPGDAAWLLFGTFFVLLVLRVPVAFALGLACLLRALTHISSQRPTASTNGNSPA